MSQYVNRIMKVGEQLRLTLDNWQNTLTGLGTARDKTQYSRFFGQAALTESELTALYHNDDTAKRIVATLPKEMVRQGWQVKLDDAETADDVNKKLKNLKTSRKVRDAMIWGRLYGGAAVLIGADDGLPPDQPLNEAGIATVKFLHVIDKRHLQPEDVFGRASLDDFFGEPETYRITPRRGGGNVVVHRSRLLLFGGAHTSDEERDRLGHWDYSVLQHVYDKIRQFNTVFDSTEHLVSDMSQAVMKIQGLMEMIAGKNKEDLQTRMEMVDMSRSVARALVLDADNESFERQDSHFTSLDAILDKFMLRLAAAAEMPVTLLMGRSPAGMNATGDSDFRLWYDSVRTDQENRLAPELERLIEICFLAQDGPTGGQIPDGWSLKFNRLWQMTEQEQADLEKKTAEKDKIYVDAGVLLPEEVAMSRFREGGFSLETDIDLDVRQAVLEDELERMQEPPAPPPMINVVDPNNPDPQAPPPAAQPPQPPNATEEQS